MEPKLIPEAIVGFYRTLADAEATLNELQAAGIPYPDIRLNVHAPDDPDRPTLEAARLPERCWSIAVLLDDPGRAQAAEEVLRRHQPLAIGRQPAPNRGRSSADRGAIAWRHYVFETSLATDAVSDAAGTTGTTGVISSGVFASGALAEGNPPARQLGGSDQQPSSDDRAPMTASDRERSETELKP